MASHEKICYWFHIITPFSLHDTHIFNKWNVCLQAYEDNRLCSKIGLFLRKMQTPRINNSRTLCLVINIKYENTMKLQKIPLNTQRISTHKNLRMYFALSLVKLGWLYKPWPNLNVPKTFLWRPGGQCFSLDSNEH